MNEKAINLPSAPRILVARTDRIGDVVLSLPVFASLRAAYPEAHICALTRDYTSGLLDGRDDLNEIISFDAPGSRIPWSQTLRIAKEIRERKFDIAIALYLNFSVALVLKLAGVPVRLGPATKAAQFLLTDKIVQRRSKGTRHEADHNLDLLQPLGVAPVRESSITVSSDRKFFEKTEGKPLIGIHPGHGGSSRNWPETNYSQLIKLLTESGADVAITGSQSEMEMVERIRRASGSPSQVYIGNGDLKNLAAALSELDVCVASSTGPLHIASATGTPVVGIYCPIFVCLPERWGPIGKDDVAIRPQVEPCEKCVDAKCDHFDCMEQITVERVKQAALNLVKITAGAR